MSNYAIHTDIKHGPLELIDVAAIGRDNDPWFNQSLCRVNDCVVRVGVLEGEFHWHHHDEEDEYFYVVAGRLLIDVGDKTVELSRARVFWCRSRSSTVRALPSARSCSCLKVPV